MYPLDALVILKRLFIMRGWNLGNVLNTCVEQVAHRHQNQLSFFKNSLFYVCITVY